MRIGGQRPGELFPSSLLGRLHEDLFSDKSYVVCILRHSNSEKGEVKIMKHLNLHELLKVTQNANRPVTKNYALEGS